MIQAAFYDTKPYDRLYFGADTSRVTFNFHEFRLNAATASSARGAKAVCVFVNDALDRA